MLYIKALSIGKVAINLTETKLGKRQLPTKIKKTDFNKCCYKHFNQLLSERQQPENRDQFHNQAFFRRCTDI